jgi:predicted Zn-dependent protease
MVVIPIIAVAALLAQHPETMSLLNEPLYPPALSKQERVKAETEYAAARTAYEKQPGDPTVILAFEQANLALGRVGDAIEILTHGLEANPDEPRLLLERGRTYIVIRKFDVAQRDLRKAAGSIPAAKCALGFALYLDGNFKDARDTYAGCGDPGAFGALAERRAGVSPLRPAPGGAAPTAPAPIRFPGSVSPPRHEPSQPIAKSYLDAIDKLLAGDADTAREVLKKIVEKHRRNGWMDPAYIAAEADYAKLKKPARGKKKKS